MSGATTVNVATHLAALAESRPHALAVAFPQSRDGRGRVAYTRLTFRQLHEESDRFAHGLEAAGVGRGVRAALMVPPSLDFFALTFALFKIGAVPVMIDPGMGVRNLGKCLAEAQPHAFIGIPKAHLARRLLGWARETIQITVTTGRVGGSYRLARLRKEGAPRGRYPQAPTTSDETAAILFTSGSTGVAKGVVYTHGIFGAQIEMLRRTYRIEPGEIDLSTFPLFALFGPALGMSAIIPDMDPTRPANVDPATIIAAIEDFGVTNLFGSPALLNRVGRYCAEHSIRLPTLRRVISAGAPVPANVVERFASLLQGGAEVFTPYGATEALPVASIGSDEIARDTRAATERGCGVCVGRPVAPVEVRIIPIDDGPIPDWGRTHSLGAGEIGEIVVSGPVVSASYFNRPAANDLAKVSDPRDGTVWHRTGDLGYRDGRGRLWFCGRKSQRVVTAAGTLYTIPSEAVFNTQPGIFRSALVGVPGGGAVHPVLCVELEKEVTRRCWPVIELELRVLAEAHPHTRTITTFLPHAAFPVDIRHNAKIFREKLADWAARRLRHHRWASAAIPVETPPTFDAHAPVGAAR